jgi:hypothetical protein
MAVTSVRIGKKAEPEKTDAQRQAEELDVLRAERTRADEILAMGEKYQMPDEAKKAIREGQTVDTFRASVLETVTKRQTETGKIRPELPTKVAQSKDAAQARRAAGGKAVTAAASRGALSPQPAAGDTIRPRDYDDAETYHATFAFLAGSNGKLGAADVATEEFKRQFNEVYTPEVLNNMWWWQADVPFFATVRDEFALIITNA